MVELCLIWGIGFPFLGTVLGAGLVWLARWESGALRRAAAGCAAGVMGWAGLFSLLLPGLRLSANAWWGVLGGIGFLGLTALLTGRGGHRLWLVALAVVLHNIPEGMASGISFGSWLAGTGVGLEQAIAVGWGIGLQNLPDGAMVALPLRQQGMSRGRAFLTGVLSALVEPVAAGAMLLWAGQLSWLLPGLMGFAAGAMGFVICTELVPAMELGQKREGLWAMLGGIGLMALLV